ncbi:hypothetical protein ACUWEX_06040 [Okibacterium fritillariae]|jgi:hypothetical protein|uniref:Uncharacterized protein n=1 Tax=Okibacterium fritillariae TaxID=123320 RepID=A0A1T5J3Z8_9MICO|nr:hypothetical protein [Okibacterium fritillariae]SKC46165.1 hypothetical protein SAMN06309945_1198 [Okibacterium fritillariae]
MRKYLMNTSILGAVTGAWSVIQTTRKGPRDWRLALAWASWIISLALAIGSVAEENQRKLKK